MSFYSELAQTTNEMLAEFGQPVIVTSFEMGQEDTATGVVSQPSISFTTVGVLLDYDYRNFGDSTVPYQAVSSADKRLLLTATTVVNTGDLFQVDGVVYKAHVVKCVNPAATRVLYDIWVQK
jgi:hypothetical protein